MLPKATKTGNLKGVHSRLPLDVVHNLVETKRMTGFSIQKIIGESLRIAAPILRASKEGRRERK